MKLLSVIPLSKSVRKETLSYFSIKDVAPGTIVSVPLRNKVIDALVTEALDAQKEKGVIKDASFALKKITKVKGVSFLGNEYLSAAQDTARYFGTTVGALLHLLVPQALLVSFAKLTPRIPRPESKDGTRLEKVIYQAPLNERISFYKTFIRESFAKKKSVYFCVPTLEDLEYFKDALEKGIETYTITLSSETAVKKIITEYNRTLKDEHPLLIIGTAPYLVFPDHLLGTIIIEHESAHSYKSLSAPYIDYRTFVECYAENARIKLILADTLLRIETLWRHEAHELGEIALPSYRTDTGSHIEIVDMRRQKADGTRVPFRLFSKLVRDSIDEKIKERKHLFLFALRKGLSSVTLCKDCGTTVDCDVCGSPVVLYENKKSQVNRIFACNKCKKQKDPNTVCRNCGSWNLVPLGIGTDLVERHLQELYPEIPIFRIDREATKTRLHAKRVIENWRRSPGGILVGTEMALLYMPKIIDTSYIISFDSLFTIPSFRMNEKILHIILGLTEKTHHSIVIQTQNPDEKVLRSLASGNLVYLVRDEIAERKLYEYPPFATFIKISFRGTKENVTQEKKILQEMFHDYSPTLYQSYTPEKSSLQKIFTIHATIKVSRADWSPGTLVPHGSIDEQLLGLIKSLPPQYKIQVDPEDLL
jgi:primosomal protein N'